MLSVDKIISKLTQYLQNAGIICAKLEAKILVSHVLGIDFSEIIFCHRDISQSEITKIDSLIKRRISGEPICKIIGNKDFYKYNFIVDTNVLSPRPDTETILESCLKIAFNMQTPKILELGTGSGCILLSLLSELKSSIGVGIDVSNMALNICQKNANKLGVASRCKLINASWFDEDIIEKLGQEYDIIVTNPPYIPSGDIETLDKEVRLYDPLLALDGGKDGMKHYRQIAKLSPQLLKTGGYIFIEAGINQANDITLLFEKEGLHLVSVIKDLQNIERCVILKK